jgi:hypothetical protein
MAEFRKSSYSDNNAAACVEVAGALNALRDSKNPGLVLGVDLGVFLIAVKADRFENR